jgi:hypothetical protein
MDISEYRERFASFNSSLELVRFRNHVGLESELSVDEVYDSHSDLFSFSAIAALKSLREQAPDGQETQRAGLDKLITSACIRFCEINANEVTNELKRCEAAATIQWRGETLTLEEVLQRLTHEPNKDLRRDLHSRWLESILECSDLRIARNESLNESAKGSGFESFSALESGRTAIDAQAELSSLLKQTESTYNTALTKVLPQVQDLSRDELEVADLAFIFGLPWLDKYYPATEFFRIQSETMRGLGIRLDQQRGIQIDSQPRPERKRSAACFPVAPPSNVRLAMLAPTGAASFLEAMSYSGLAQHYAWCSPNLASRNPEFIYSTDQATSKSYANLFQYLPSDARWNFEFIPGIAESKASLIARDIAFHLALRVRRLSATASGSFEDLSEESGDTRKRVFEEATSFRLRSPFVFPGLGSEEQPLTDLRALAFSFVLREHLRVRFGHRWWASRKAGDELIDLWSTGSRYSVEELSSLLGFGDLNFDLLAEVINVGLTGD